MMKRNMILVSLLVVMVGLVGCFSSNNDSSLTTPAANKALNIGGNIALNVANGSIGNAPARVISAATLRAHLYELGSTVDLIPNVPVSAVGRYDFLNVPWNTARRTIVVIKQNNVNFLKRFLGKITVPTSTTAPTLSVNINESSTANALVAEKMQANLATTATNAAALDVPLNPDLTQNLTSTDTEAETFIRTTASAEVAAVETQVGTVVKTTDGGTNLTTSIEETPAVVAAVTTAVTKAETQAAKAPYISSITVDSKTVYSSSTGSTTQAATSARPTFVVNFATSVVGGKVAAGAQAKVHVKVTETKNATVKTKNICWEYMGTTCSGYTAWTSVFTASPEPMHLTPATSFTFAVSPTSPLAMESGSTIKVELLNLSSFYLDSDSTVPVQQPTNVVGYFTVP